MIKLKETSMHCFNNFQFDGKLAEPYAKIAIEIKNRNDKAREDIWA